MIDEGPNQRKYRYLPGDFAAMVYPECRDVRTSDNYLTPKQRIEKSQYVLCIRCGRTCAGTCSNSLQVNTSGNSKTPVIDFVADDPVMPRTNGISVDFSGPLTFTEGPGSIFDSQYAKSQGVYIWTIPQDSDGTHLIHYVGETISFARRQKEHLIQILGFNYAICDPDKAKSGINEMIWPGLWRKKSPDAVGECLREYEKLNDVVLRYLDAMRVFFAPTTVDSKMRKHIEGCIEWNLRSNHPEHKVLYPDDSHIGTSADGRNNGLLQITCPEIIKGLDRIIQY